VPASGTPIAPVADATETTIRGQGANSARGGDENRERARVLALSNLSWGSLMEPRESLRPGALTSALKLQPVPITRAVIRSAGRSVAVDSSGCCETTNYRLLPAKSCGTISDPEVDIRVCTRDGNSPAVNANNAKHPGRQIADFREICTICKRLEAAPSRTPWHAPRTRLRSCEPRFGIIGIKRPATPA